MSVLVAEADAQFRQTDSFCVENRCDKFNIFDNFQRILQQTYFHKL